MTTTPPPGELHSKGDPDVTWLMRSAREPVGVETTGRDHLRHLLLGAEGWSLASGEIERRRDDAPNLLERAEGLQAGESAFDLSRTRALARAMREAWVASHRRLAQKPSRLSFSEGANDFDTIR